MVAISIQGLVKRFGDNTVLKNIDLVIEHGELFFLLGPSGCGKTTLLRHIAGFYQPDSGKVLFDSEDVTRLPAHKRDTGMMFQSYALWPHLSVNENIAFGLQERRVSKDEIAQRVEEALTLVHMAGLGERRIQQLSGGQQQRVALARALVVRPKCLLLDEPLSNLDAKLRLEMRAEIRRICKEFGLTGIYVTHDQEEALSMADRMAIMESGQIVQLGSALEVYRNPVNRMVAEFIGETNFVAGQVVDTLEREHLFVVDTAIGLLHARSNRDDWRPATGTAVTLSIRPEALRLNSQAAPRNAWSGRVADAVYLGAMAQYMVVIGDSTQLKMTQFNPDALLRPSDSSIAVTVAEQDVVLLPG